VLGDLNYWTCFAVLAVRVWGIVGVDIEPQIGMKKEFQGK